MNSPTSVICDADPSALTIEEARRRIHDLLPRITDSETIDTRAALGRICAHAVHSPMSVPSFRASAMDGYAVRVADCDRPLRVVGRSMAGHPGTDVLDSGTCQRITTGARVPDQADAVVQQENVERNEDVITVLTLPAPGLHVRNPGTDSQAGGLLLEAGSRLGAAEIALLASHGITRVSVLRLLSIAVFSTGDELVQPGSQLESGQIYDANRPLLLSVLENKAIQLIDLGICNDAEDALQRTFAAAGNADLVISSGGVSVGDADHVRSVLERNGQLHLWKIAMKPGRPLTFGFCRPRQAYFGLPGNPVSAAITTLLFVIPAIRYMLSQTPACAGSLTAPPLQLPLRDRLYKNPGRVEYQRAIMARDDQGHWQVGTTGMQDSHVLSSLHKANCLIELSVENSGAEAGETVTVYPFTHFTDPVL